MSINRPLTAEEVAARAAARVANEEALAPFMAQAEQVLCKKWGMTSLPEELKALPSTKKLLKDCAKDIMNADKPKRARAPKGSKVERAKAKLLEDFQFAFGSFQKKMGKTPEETLVDELVLLALSEPKVRTRTTKAAPETA